MGYIAKYIDKYVALPLTQVATDGEVVDVVEDEPLVAEVNVLDVEPELAHPVETDVRYVLQLPVHHESSGIGILIMR